MSGRDMQVATTLITVVKDAIDLFQPLAQSGVAVAVLRDGRLILADGFGLRDRAAGTPVTASTCFPIGSATKAFTAMQLSINAASRMFSLDQPITDFAPDFAMQDGKASNEMNLADMLSQRSGLPRFDTLWYLGPFTRTQLYFRLRNLAQIPGAFRQDFLYNNLMYMTAGHLLECVTGTTWEDHVRQSILSPLEMVDTSFALPDLMAKADYAKGYQKNDPIPLKDYTNIGPAGSINSTVLDLAKWVQLFLDKGLTSSGDVLLDSLALQRLYSKQTDTGDGRLFYGLGWYVDVLKGEPYVFHDGVADGFTAYVSFMPEQKLGAVILTNQHTSFTSTLKDMWLRKVAERIYDYLLNAKITGMQVPTFPDSAISSPLPDSTMTANLEGKSRIADDVTGMYSNAGFGDMAIGRLGSSQVISYYGQSWPLVRQTDDLFVVSIHAYGADLPLRGQFTRDFGGRVTGLALKLTREANALPVLFVRR